MKMKDHDWTWVFAVIVILVIIGISIFAGHSVTAANKDVEIMNLQSQLETANASLTEANVELAFWKDTMNRLAEGEQFAGVDIKYGRPNVED